MVESLLTSTHATLTGSLTLEFLLGVLLPVGDFHGSPVYTDSITGYLVQHPLISQIYNWYRAGCLKGDHAIILTILVIYHTDAGTSLL